MDKLHRLNVNMKDEESCACVQMTYEIVEGTSVIRSYVSITNEGVSPLVLESVTSLVLPMGSVHSNASWTHEWVLTEGHFDWLGEGRWQERKLDDFSQCVQQEMTGHDPRGEHAVVSTGAWSTGSMAPLAFLENKDAGAVWAFQVEHNGAWRWEVGNNTVDGYFAVSGPTNINHAWTRSWIRMNASPQFLLLLCWPQLNRKRLRILRNIGGLAVESIVRRRSRALSSTIT